MSHIPFHSGGTKGEVEGGEVDEGGSEEGGPGIAYEPLPFP